ncbi:putative short-chain dehydrogenase [Phaeomoniella chlamydospora]|uniref:Putative short-chain dehydrogenase n=1 Tax=Phaeomoniella chlamydospora TaxID=158046 RepID=A0A0G2EGR5_PHACM|nr:putative short-chain dehydrogenase [Phaeomoniella chlamydospora]
MASKVALVTASSAGLGAAVVKQLAAKSFNIVINYHSRESKALEVAQACESISSSPASTPRYHIVKADVTTRAGIQHLVSETIKQFGRLDVVVSNTGYTRMTNFMKFEEGCLEEDWDRCFTTNVKAHLWLFEAAKPYLEKAYEESGGQNRGSFVTIASTAGIKPSGSSLPYGVSKAAQIHLSKCLAVICGPSIRINTVSPGLMLTEWGSKFPAERIEAMKEKATLKMVSEVDDVAGTVVELSTNGSITGQNFVVDGGFSLG